MLLYFTEPPLTCFVPLPICEDERFLPILMDVQQQCQKQGTRIQFFPKNAASIQMNDVVILPCAIATNAGSDITVTLNMAQLKGEDYASL